MRGPATTGFGSKWLDVSSLRPTIAAFLKPLNLLGVGCRRYLPCAEVWVAPP